MTLLSRISMIRIKNAGRAGGSASCQPLQLHGPRV